MEEGKGKEGWMGRKERKKEKWKVDKEGKEYTVIQTTGHRQAQGRIG